MNTVPCECRVQMDDDGDGHTDAEIVYCPLHVAAPELRAVAEALLLFYTVGEWSAEASGRWLALTGHEEATTRVLADFARAALRKAVEA